MKIFKHFFNISRKQQFCDRTQETISGEILLLTMIKVRLILHDHFLHLKDDLNDGN